MTGKSHKIDLINVTGTTDATDFLHANKIRPTNDQNDGTITTSHVNGPNLHATMTAPMHSQPSTLPIIYMSDAPTTQPDFNATTQIIFAQLKYIKTYIHAMQSGSTLPITPPKLYDMNPSTTPTLNPLMDNRLVPTITFTTPMMTVAYTPTSCHPDPSLSTTASHVPHNADQCSPETSLQPQRIAPAFPYLHYPMNAATNMTTQSPLEPTMREPTPSHTPTPAT